MISRRLFSAFFLGLGGFEQIWVWYDRSRAQGRGG
jgi:hypothetical protein